MENKEIILSPSKFHAPKVIFTEQGLSIRQIIEKQGNICPCIVEINGKPLPVEQWDYLPCSNDHILISVPLMGGDNKKNPLRTILTIVVVVLAYVYGGPAGGAAAKWLGAGATGVKIGSAIGVMAVSTAGMMLVNKIAPVRYSTDQKQSYKDSPTYSINGGSNQANPWGPVPVNLGINRVYPPLGSGSYTEIIDEVTTKYKLVGPSYQDIMNMNPYYMGPVPEPYYIPYNEVIGSDEYFRMLVIWGYGPLDIKDIKIGNTLLSSYEDVEVQTREGWSDDEPITLFPSQVNQETIGLKITAAEDPLERTAKPYCDEISVDVAFPSGLVEYLDDGSRYSKFVRILINYREVGVGEWINHEVKDFTDQTTSAIRYGTRWTVDNTKEYEVQILRQTDDSDDPQIIDEIYWVNLRSIFTGNPIQFPYPVAATAIRIKATEQLYGSIDNLNAIVSSYAPVWVDDAWTVGEDNYVITNNPAALYRHVLMSPANAKARTASQLNDTELGEWYDFCVTNGYAFNLYCDTKTSVWDLCSDIAVAGRASPIIKNGLWNITVDSGTQTLVQHITPRNSWGFNSTKILFNPPHAFRVQFINEDNGYQWDERIVYDDGYNSTNATIFESIEFPGITDPDLIWKFGRFHIAQARLRPEVYTLNMDFEHLVACRGDKVRVSHDVPLWGVGSGRVKQLTVNVEETHITHIILDEYITMEVGKTYVCRFRLADGSTLIQNIVLDIGETNIIELVTPLLIASGPAIGDLAMFGETDIETVELLIQSIRRSSDYVAELTMVDLASAIYTADSGEIPVFNPNMTTPVDVTRIVPDPPTIGDTKTGSDVSVISGGGSVSSILVYLVAPSNPIRIKGYRVRYRLENETQWQYTSESTSLTIPILGVSDQLTYEIQAQSISVYGIESQWTSVTTGSSDIPHIIPASATDISVTQVNSGSIYNLASILVTFTPSSPLGVYAYSEIYGCIDDLTYQYLGRDSTGSFIYNGLGTLYKVGDTVYIKVRSVSKYEDRETLPETYDDSIVIQSTTNFASFHFGLNDLWGGNAAIGNVATTIVIGNLDGTPEIKLGPSADSLTIANMATYQGFFADGNGYFRGGSEHKYFLWNGEISIKAGENLLIDSATQKITLGTGITLDATIPAILMGDATDYLTGAGKFEGLSGGLWKYHLGDPAADYIAYDGEGNLHITGEYSGSMTIDGTTANTFTVNSDLGDVTSKLIFGRTTGGNGEISYDGGTRIAFNKGIHISRQADISSALYIDAPTNYDPIIFWYENGGAKWSTRYDSSQDAFEFYSYAITADILRLIDTGDVQVLNGALLVNATSLVSTELLRVNGDIYTDGDIIVQGGDIKTTSGNLSLDPDGDLIFNPTGNDVYPSTSYDINLGLINKKFLTLHAAELWVETLVAQDTMATIGGRILVGPTTQLTSDLGSGETTIYVKHNNLASGDRVYMESNGQVEFMSVDSGASGVGPYSYTVTRNLDGSGANNWNAGDAVFNTGTTGDGFIDIYSLRGVKSSSDYGPTIVGNVRNSATYNDWIEAWAIGNLNGIYGYSSDTYGAAFGLYDVAEYMTIDPTYGIRFFNENKVRVALFGTDMILGVVDTDKSNLYIDGDGGNTYWRNNETNIFAILPGGGSGIFRCYEGASLSFYKNDALAPGFIQWFSAAACISSISVSANSDVLYMKVNNNSSSDFGRIELGVTYCRIELNDQDSTDYKITLSKTTTSFSSDSDKDLDLGKAAAAWDDVYGDDFNNVADIPFLDDRDDLSFIMNLKGSGNYDKRTGLEIIDDNTLPDFVKTVSKDGEKDILLDPDGKPYFTVKAMLGWHSGAIRQLNKKVIELEQKYKN